jgi:hydrogenase maturation protein HypF
MDHIGVQHHHAHIASCLADNDADGPVIGVAFDGTGFGPDGTIWGGEVLVCDLLDHERVASFEPVPLPGGAAAIREPWRMAAAYLDATFGTEIDGNLDVVSRNSDRWRDVLAVATSGINSPPTSSAGRLFDAVAAILGVRDAVSYEGQAAIELEQSVDPTESGSYSVGTSEGDRLLIHGTDLVRAVVDDRARGVPTPVIAARFHNGIADTIVDVCARIRESSGISTVALSGGVFQNVVLTERTTAGLRNAGLTVLTHSRVPANDGGISLGQVVIAAARERR